MKTLTGSLFVFIFFLFTCANAQQKTVSSIEVIGNSITRHGISASIGWYGAWGMAASAADSDYIHHLQALVQGQQGIKPSLTLVSAAYYEQHFWTITARTLLAPFDTTKPDLVIFEIGDNVNKDSAASYDFRSHYDELLKDVISRNPGAIVLCFSTWWKKAAVDSMIRSAAASHGVTTVDLGVLGADPLNRASSERQFTNSNVATHPGDRGMRKIAEAAFSSLSPLLTGLTVLPSSPRAYRLAQNYPNPFNPSTTVAFSIPASSHVHLRVYDLLGRQVGELVDGDRLAGRHTVAFDAAALPSGTYFYRLETAGHIETKRMLLLR